MDDNEKDRTDLIYSKMQVTIAEWEEMFLRLPKLQVHESARRKRDDMDARIDS